VPLYEYECNRCHHRFEKLQRFSDPPASECPACGGEVAQILSAPAIQFKGSGWYVTDYAKRSSSPPSSSGNGKSATESSTAEKKKTETKAETKATKKEK
jgi:putative FmdB family regulatory protein